MLLGLLQVAGEFEGNGNLRSQGPGAAYILVADRPRLDAIEHAKHPEHVTTGTQQRHRQHLLNLERVDEFHVGAGSFRGVFSDENIFLAEFLADRRLVQGNIDGPGAAVFKTPTDVKGRVLKQSDKAALKAEKAGRAHDRGLHEPIELGGGGEFAGNLDDFVQFAGLRARSRLELDIGSEHRGEAGEHGDRGLFLRCEGAQDAGIGENRACGTRGTNGGGDQSARGRAVAEVRSTVDVDGDALAGGDGTVRNLNGGAQIVVGGARADGFGERRGLGGNSS